MRTSGDEFIARVFTVLAMVSRSQAPVSLHSVTEDTELPKPTVFRLLKSLENLGYIEAASKSSGYRVTDRILDLLPSDEEGWLRDNAMPLLQQIHGQLNETVNLGRLDGLRLRYVHIIESTQPLRWIPDDRLHEELLHTALGRAIVAYLPKDHLVAILPELCERAGYHDVEEMHQELKTIRRRGWAVEQNQSCQGVSCYAIPLFKGTGASAAISVSIPNVRLESGSYRSIVRALKAVNNQLST